MDDVPLTVFKQGTVEWLAKIRNFYVQYVFYRIYIEIPYFCKSLNHTLLENCKWHIIHWTFIMKLRHRATCWCIFILGKKLLSATDSKVILRFLRKLATLSIISAASMRYNFMPVGGHSHLTSNYYCCKWPCKWHTEGGKIKSGPIILQRLSSWSNNFVTGEVLEMECSVHTVRSTLTILGGKIRQHMENIN